MAGYIYGTRDKVHIFDLVKTKQGLEDACKYVAGLPAGSQVLFVGTKRQAKDIITQAAQRAGMPYVSERWLGGTLTNFDQIDRRIKKLKELREQRATGELKKYTKKEQLLIDKKIAKLERFLGGMEAMPSKPTALFVMDTHKENVAVKEAVKMGIPIIGMVDTNGDPRQVDYVIPVNDDALKSVELIVNAVADAIKRSPTAPKATKGKKNEKN